MPRPDDRWVLKQNLVEAIDEFADDSVEQLMAERKRADMYRVIATLLLLRRRGEAATAAAVAAALDWETPRTRIALAALEERQIATRVPAKRRSAGDLFDELVVAKAATEAEPAGNPADPRLDDTGSAGDGEPPAAS